MKKNFYFFVTFLLFIKFEFLLSDDKTKKFSLDEMLTGKMDSDESFDFYELSLPKNIEVDNLLVFTARENKMGFNPEDFLFSDPDIYISKTNKNPKNKKDSDWYSETFGNDIITIPSKDLVKINKLYVSLYCEKKCRYKFKAYVTKEIEFKLGSINSIKLSKHHSINYFLKIGKENQNYEQLKIVAYSSDQKHFHILLTKDNQSPSTQNTYQAIPSWMGGYMININDEKGNSTYHLLLQTEEESTTIKFYAFFQNTYTKISAGEPLMDSMATNSKRCYYYDMRINYNNNTLYEDKLIIQLTLFGGEAYLHFSGWNKETYNDIKDIKKLKDYTFQIISEKSVLIKKKDIERFNSEYDKNSEGEKNRLHFCIYGEEKGSYLLSASYLNDASNLQRYNYIFPGNEVNGFLPENHITSYKIIDNNINKNSNVTITLKNIQGKAKLYGYFCDLQKDLYCYFGDYKLKQSLESNQMILTRERYSSSLTDNSIFIPYTENQCYLKESSKDCKLMAVVECVNPENKLCAFSILSTFEDYPILMTPRKTYYNFISTGKNDLYKIIINDADLYSLVIVLTTNIGDAELSVSKKMDNQEPIPIGISNNKYSLPDVVRITPTKIDSKNIVGEYLVRVYCKFFSSYNLYYYTTKPKEKKGKKISKEITSSLTEGQIITDYFPYNLNYKIYSYTPGDKTAKDIKIILTRINVRFTFYVFLDLNDIKFNDKIESTYDERIFGYKWVSDSNNEVTILQNDKMYKKKGTYYIVVLRDLITDVENFNEEKINEDLVMMYYLGVTKKGIPFYLKEGIEHSVTLNKNYYYQNYIYSHYNFSQPFQFVLNILSGQVDLLMSTKELNEEDFKHIYNIIIKNTKSKSFNINYNYSTVYLQQGINDYASLNFNDLKINDEIIKTNKNNKIDIFIYIIQSQLSLKFERDSQYMIAAKTSFNKGILLISGQVYKNKLSSGAEEHFYIEEVKKRDVFTITVRFNEGIGDIYASVLDNSNELNKKVMIYPNSTNFDYKGTSIYMGKMIKIPGELFEKIGKTTLKLRILITITAKELTRNSPKPIEYYLCYSDEAKRINQNIPYQSSVLTGEFQYYTFYFDKNTQNILISLSNMNGDADLFLNYGNEIYPTPVESDWHSNSIGHEYIDINIKDNFFVKNNINNLSGYYTLLVIGYSDTTYTLYVSSHDEHVFKIIDNISTNCKCQSKNDKCYFRYDDVAKRRNYQNIINVNSTEVIFTSQYLYGNGKMYASILKEQEIYSNSHNKKYIDYFPSEKFHDASNDKYGKRNYLKVKVPENKYTIDSLILMTFICEEKTDVEITVAPLTPSGDFKYISGERENIYYLKYNDTLPPKKQAETILAYYSYKDTDSIYEFHVYLGKAKIHIYTNESKWDNVTKKTYYDYNHISEFVIQSKSDENELREFQYQKYFTEEYFNTIKPSISKGKTVLFSIMPLSNFGFYIQIINERTWINVPIGKDKTYYIKNKIMYGYFDIFEEFSSVEISVYLKEYISKRAVIYLKIIVDNKIKKPNDIGENEEDKLKHYEIPGYNNFDYMAKTDNYLGAMNINIDNIPTIKNELKNQKIVRALFSIHIFNAFYTSYYRFGNDDSLIAPQHEGQITPYNNKFDFNADQDTKVNILVTPGINNFKRIDTAPYTFYFSNTSLITKNNNTEDNKTFNGNNEVKIYSLDKISDKDDKMIIQINSCSGEYDIKISSKIVNYDDNRDDIYYQKLSSKYGRKMFLLDKLQYKHIYLSIKPKQNEKECNQGLVKDSNNIVCSKELSYLLHYYSTNEKQYYSSEPDRKLTFTEGDNDKQLIIIVPKLKDYDYHNNYRDKNNMEYNLFYTYNRTSSEYIESICYLGHYMDETSEKNKDIILIKDIKLNDKNEYILDNIDYEQPVFINILARNIKTNELIIYKPIRGKLKPSRTAKYLSYFIALIFIGLIVCISIQYYKEENLMGYKLTNSNDFGIGRDDIKYSNINMNME